MPVSQSAVWNVGLKFRVGMSATFSKTVGKGQRIYLVDVVSCSSRQVPLVSEPVPLDFHLETALTHRVTREFCE